MAELNWEEFSFYLFQEIKLGYASYYKSGFNQLVVFLDGRDITPKNIALWLQDLEKRGLVGYTLNNYQKMLKHLCRFLNQKCRTENYSFIFKWKGYKVDPPEVETLESDEQEKVIQFAYTVDYRRAIAIETFLRTGLRFDELAKLQVEDYTGESLLIEDTKNNKPRKVQILPDLAEKIKKLDSFPYLFGFKNKRLGYKNFLKFLNLCIDACGIGKRITAHRLRHTFATHLAEKDVSHFTIKDAMGHKSLTSTERYIHTTDKTIRNAMKKHSLSKYEMTEEEARKALKLATDELDRGNWYYDFTENKKRIVLVVYK